MANKVKEFANTLWWLFTIQGTITILFGLVALFWPTLTLVGLAGIFALFIIVYGIADLISAFVRMRNDKGWWISLLGGIAALIIGTFLISNPDIEYLAFAIIVGMFLVIRGIVDIIVASVAEGEDKILWVFAGILSLIAGIAVWVFPYVGSLAFIWVLGLYAVIRGTVDVSLAVRVRHIADEDVKHAKSSGSAKK